jgi:hypothetical protein
LLDERDQMMVKVSNFQLNSLWMVSKWGFQTCLKVQKLLVNFSYLSRLRLWWNDIFHLLFIHRRWHQSIPQWQLEACIRSVKTNHHKNRWRHYVVVYVENVPLPARWLSGVRSSKTKWTNKKKLSILRNKSWLESIKNCFVVVILKVILETGFCTIFFVIWIKVS